MPAATPIKSSPGQGQILRMVEEILRIETKPVELVQRVMCRSLLSVRERKRTEPIVSTIRLYL
jgi:hypothetical protein